MLFVWLLTINVAFADNLNEFDTYNADECKRVRRSWPTLTTSEKEDYISALMKIRENGKGDVLLDELVSIASVHENKFGEIEHKASSYLFWHGYLLWELESRIRNLGGKYACFGMPYWDFSVENQALAIFDDIVGGDGDPDNSYNVNGYSWDYTTEQYWVPAHCDAEGDEYPLCSLKRATSTNYGGYSAVETGDGIMENEQFADFSDWYSDTFNLPRQLLTSVEYLCWPVITSYDPIWYLFHSMVSYHQAIWTDCHDYDLIAPGDLDEYSDAYTAFCYEDGICGAMQLDDKMVFGGYLQEKEWSFIHDNDLTVRKAYHFPRWNIIYDLGDGTGFYSDSGLRERCEGKLNDDWFILNENENDKILESSSQLFVGPYVSSNQLSIILFIAMLIGFGLWFLLRRKKQKLMLSNTDNYGSF